MNKRGQFYIIIAIVISLALIAITTRINKIKEPFLFEDFNDISNNYVTESRHIVNFALFNQKEGQQIRDQVDNFTLDFLTIAKLRNPTLQVLFVYSNGTNLTVGNHFNSSISVVNSTILGSEQELVEEISLNIGGIDFINQVPVKASNFGQEWYTVSPSGDLINISIGGIIHNFNTNPQSPELKAIVRTSSTGEQVFIFGGNQTIPPDIKFGPQNKGLVQQNVYE